MADNNAKSLAAALAKAQSELTNVLKTSENPFHKSKYADLATVLDTVRPVLAKHGLSLMQFPTDTDKVGTVGLKTVLLHESGEYMSETFSMPCGGKAQDVGSALTYARRYSAMAVLGVAAEDDDGNAASGKGPNKEEQVALEKKLRDRFEKANGTEAKKQVWFETKASSLNEELKQTLLGYMSKTVREASGK